MTGREPGTAVSLQGVEVSHPVLNEGVVLLVIQGPTPQGALAGPCRVAGAVLKASDVLRGAAQMGQGLARRGDAGLGVDGRAVAGGSGTAGVTDGVGFTGGARPRGGSGIHGTAFSRWRRRAR